MKSVHAIASSLLSTIVTTTALTAAFISVSGCGLDAQSSTSSTEPLSQVERLLIDEATGDSIKLADIYRAIFEPDAVKISFREIGDYSNGREIQVVGEIYYSEGDIFLLNFAKGETNPPANFATVDGDLYRWTPDEPTGEKLTRYPGDAAALAAHFIDPAAIAQKIYQQTQSQPDLFTQTAVEGGTDYEYKDASVIFRGIRVLEEPLWLKQFISYSGCFGDQCSPERRARYIFEIDRPLPVNEIPDEVRQLPKDVNFEPSERTARDFITRL